MIELSKAVSAWGTPAFEAVLKREIERLDTVTLPLQQGLSSTSYATDTKPEVMIISTAEEGPTIRVKTGIFFTGILAGCSCANDPTPVEEQSEYCVVRFDIDKATGQAHAILLQE